MPLLAIATGAAVAWWIGLAVFVLVVIPLVAFVAVQLIQVVAEIRRYADDIRAHGGGLAEELTAVNELGRTRELTDALRGGLATYAGAVGRIARRPSR